MIGRLIRRLLLGAATILGVYTLTFVMVISIPGNPLRQSERKMSPEIEAALRARYGMNDNWTIYRRYLAGALRGDLGPSFTYADWTCNQILARSLPVSVTLGLSAILIALLVGVPVGVLSAVRRGRWPDVASLALVLPGISVPTFVIGSALLTLFAVHLRWLPVGGWGTAAHLPLPCLTLALPYAAYMARLTRMSLLDALASEYVRTAAAKGLRPRDVVGKHALKPALLPVVSFLGPATAQALTGSFVVEKVFGVPGLGQHFVNAALNRDVGLILGTVLVFSTILVLLNLVVDAVYASLDPRITDAL
jgi:oligopeptide transport system permease protein